MQSSKKIKEQPESGASSKAGTLIQHPFRCTQEFSARLVRAKGSMMRITGEKVSDNFFFLQLLEIGLAEVEHTYGSDLTQVRQ